MKADPILFVACFMLGMIIGMLASLAIVCRIDPPPDKGSLLYELGPEPPAPTPDEKIQYTLRH